MLKPRVYFSTVLTLNSEINFPKEIAHHLQQVLRLNVNDEVIIFNGQSGEYLAKIIAISKKSLTVRIKEFIDVNRESSLKIHLGQVISRSERMRFTLQKAVELGVSEITPLLSTKCGVKIKSVKSDAKISHWEKIIISAAEQSGRTILPKLNPVIGFSEWLMQNPQGVVLDPCGQKTLSDVTYINNTMNILVGSESGLTVAEINQALSHQYIGLRLGPRILRTETAALSLVSILQFIHGDFQ